MPGPTRRRFQIDSFLARRPSFEIAHRMNYQFPRWRFGPVSRWYLKQKPPK